MNRRAFSAGSLAAAGSTLLPTREGAVPISATPSQIPGATSPAEVSGARFPDGFVWGMATAASQVEGAWNQDGMSPPSRKAKNRDQPNDEDKSMPATKRMAGPNQLVADEREPLPADRLGPGARPR